MYDHVSNDSELWLMHMLADKKMYRTGGYDGHAIFKCTLCFYKLFQLLLMCISAYIIEILAVKQAIYVRLGL